jgi:electron transfer flavoprotein beta subunit
MSVETLRVLVCVKIAAVIDGEPRVASDGRSIEPQALNWDHNEWDLHAVEEALQLRESFGTGEVVVVSVGGERAEETLRWCMAMGVDRGVRVDAELSEPIGIARCLAEVTTRESPNLVLTGAQSVDGMHSATPAAMAGLLGFTHVPFVTDIAYGDPTGTAVVLRELEGGSFERVRIPVPAVLSIQTGINHPRYVTLGARKRALAAHIEVLDAPLAVKLASRIRSLTTPVGQTKVEFLGGDTAEVAESISKILARTIG